MNELAKALSLENQEPDPLLFPAVAFTSTGSSAYTSGKPSAEERVFPAAAHFPLTITYLTLP